MEIERFAIHDGPGIRSVVFLKGCPLHCPWCANPESQSPEPERLRARRDGSLVATKEPSLTVGQPVSIDAVMAVLERDADYYEQSGGGITFSGGECMMHADALLELLNACKTRGWHTAIETSGMAPKSSFEKAIPYTDLFLFDLKHTDAQKLKEVTGADLDLILRNLLICTTGSGTLCKRELHSVPDPVVFRMPCIPKFNLEDSHFEKAFAIAKEYGISRIDLLPYHVLGMEKYHQLGREYTYPVTKGLSPDALKPYEQKGQSLGLDVRIVG